MKDFFCHLLVSEIESQTRYVTNANLEFLMALPLYS